MRPIVLALGTLLTASLVSLGCAPPDDSEPAPQQQQPEAAQPQIYGGSNDNSNDAVVYLYSEQGFACTGTIIAKNGSTAYVLTAAHCNGMDWVVQDDNISCFFNGGANCDGVWQVAEQTVHPNYNGDAGDGYDFSVIRFSGADAGTPVIPAATSPDGVSVGTQVDIVGYGETESGQSSDQRLHVQMPVDEVYTLFLRFDQTGGEGSCSGDSGGPALFNNTVVGVTSFGDQNCTQFGFDGRVAAVYNGFIAPIIGGAVTENCDTCFEDEVNSPSGDCAPQVDACFGNAGCASLAECIGPCTTGACVQACADASNNASIDLYNAIFDCWCVSCATLCTEECDPGTGTTSSSGNGLPTGPGTTGVGGGAAAAGGGNAGGAPSGNGGDSNGGASGDNAEDGDSSSCGCKTVGAPTGANQSALGLLGLALVGVFVARRRR